MRGRQSQLAASWQRRQAQRARTCQPAARVLRAAHQLAAAQVKDAHCRGHRQKGACWVRPMLQQV